MPDEPSPFLSANQAASATRPEDFPLPVREDNLVTPLLLSAAMYPDLERLVLGARSTVYLAFRVFDPETRTRSPEAAAAGLADWATLLKHAVERGVTVRVLLTDFEPTFAHMLHGSSWKTFRTLAAMASTLSDEDRERFEMIVAQHPGEVGWAVRQTLRLPMGFVIRRVLKELVADDAVLEDLVDVRPGLWRYHELKGGRARFRRGPAPRLWPATHHHKFAVVDGAVAIIGGIDIDERRWETRRYAQQADQSWHDVSVRLEGPAAADAEAHFRMLWNADLPRYVEITGHWMTNAERALVIEPLDPIEDAPKPVAAIPEGKARVQLLRTLSRRNRSLFAVGPKPHIRELLAGYRNLIFSARRMLYVEAQFFRYQRASHWIVEQARREPALQIIILLPQAPDEVAFGGERDNPAHRHGEYLQSRALLHLKARLGDRIGLFSLAKKQPLTDEERAFVRDRGAVFGSGMIYVHSKLALADDEYALVSSANINNRSFSWDSEFGLLWQDPEGIKAMRTALWGQVFGLPAAETLAMALSDWRRIADANVTTPPADRQGFVVPYQLARAGRFGRPAWFIPDDLV